MVYSIVYLSSSNGLFDDQDINNILAKSRKNNTSLDVTGALLYCNGNIIQVLEGDQDALESLFVKIERDPRHSRVIKLFQGPVPQRSFETWAMGYNTTDIRNMEELKDQLLFIENPHMPSVGDNKVISLLQTFYKNNYRN